MKHKIFTSFFLLFIFFICGCGYKPTSIITKKTMGEKIYVDVKIDIQNLNNSILIKDALIEMLGSKLDAEIVHEKSLANATIYGELKSVSETALESDVAGYSKIYRETVTISISYVGVDGKGRNFTVSNYYDFIVSDDSVVTNSKKEEAIKLAINKALSDVFSRIAINSL